MALKKTYCVNHSDRPAVGVCVITRQPVCEECTTRYEGVNYSRAGLAILKARRASEAGTRFWPDRIWFIVLGVLSPAFLIFLYFALVTLTRWLMRMEAA